MLFCQIVLWRCFGFGDTFWPSFPPNFATASGRSNSIQTTTPWCNSTRNQSSFMRNVTCPIQRGTPHNRLIWQQNGNVSWWRRAQIKQLAWPMAQRQIGHRKSSLVLTARFPVVKWRSRSVAKSALRAHTGQTPERARNSRAQVYERGRKSVNSGCKRT